MLKRMYIESENICKEGMTNVFGIKENILGCICQLQSGGFEGKHFPFSLKFQIAMQYNLKLYLSMAGLLTELESILTFN